MSESATAECFTCGKTLDLVVPEVLTQAYGGITFVSSGNYGSRLYDPQFGTDKLHIIICDECAEGRASRIVAVNRETSPPKYSYRKFESFDEFKESAS